MAGPEVASVTGIVALYSFTTLQQMVSGPSRYSPSFVLVKTRQAMTLSNMTSRVPTTMRSGKGMASR